MNIHSEYVHRRDPSPSGNIHQNKIMKMYVIIDDAKASTRMVNISPRSVQMGESTVAAATPAAISKFTKM